MSRQASIHTFHTCSRKYQGHICMHGSLQLQPARSIGSVVAIVPKTGQRSVAWRIMYPTRRCPMVPARVCGTTNNHARFFQLLAQKKNRRQQGTKNTHDRCMMTPNFFRFNFSVADRWTVIYNVIFFILVWLKLYTEFIDGNLECRFFMFYDRWTCAPTGGN